MLVDAAWNFECTIDRCFWSGEVGLAFLTRTFVWKLDARFVRNRTQHGCTISCNGTTSIGSSHTTTTTQRLWTRGGGGGHQDKRTINKNTEQETQEVILQVGGSKVKETLTINEPYQPGPHKYPPMIWIRCFVLMREVWLVFLTRTFVLKIRCTIHVRNRTHTQIN